MRGKVKQKKHVEQVSSREEACGLLRTQFSSNSVPWPGFPISASAGPEEGGGFVAEDEACGIRAG